MIYDTALDKLLEQPTPRFGDCPICMVRMPSSTHGRIFYGCCGKMVCSGCSHSPVYDHLGKKSVDKCPFCRSLHPTTDEALFEMKKKQAKANNVYAVYSLGLAYFYGRNGLRRSIKLAMKLWHRSGDLGCADAYLQIGFLYGSFRYRDKVKTLDYIAKAAELGHEEARYFLGKWEMMNGNTDEAIKHLTIAATNGEPRSLTLVQELYQYGLATKEEYTKLLRSYQEYVTEIKSVQRDEAAVITGCPYY
jgi:TPR repeat protein